MLCQAGPPLYLCSPRRSICWHGESHLCITISLYEWLIDICLDSQEDVCEVYTRAGVRTVFAFDEVFLWLSFLNSSTLLGHRCIFVSIVGASSSISGLYSIHGAYRHGWRLFFLQH